MIPAALMTRIALYREQARILADTPAGSPDLDERRDLLAEASQDLRRDYGALDPAAIDAAPIAQAEELYAASREADIPSLFNNIQRLLARIKAADLCRDNPDIAYVGGHIVRIARDETPLTLYAHKTIGEQIKWSAIGASRDEVARWCDQNLPRRVADADALVAWATTVFAAPAAPAPFAAISIPPQPQPEPESEPEPEPATTAAPDADAVLDADAEPTTAAIVNVLVEYYAMFKDRLQALSPAESDALTPEDCAALLNGARTFKLEAACLPRLAAHVFAARHNADVPACDQLTVVGGRACYLAGGRLFVMHVTPEHLADDARDPNSFAVELTEDRARQADALTTAFADLNAADRDAILDWIEGRPDMPRLRAIAEARAALDRLAADYERTRERLAGELAALEASA